tara:strand:- start:48482 stop:48772 length:291 start_codon:yes stop_codon:yes gene_type:complete
MSKESEICETCCSMAGEIGFVIRKGDEVSSITISNGTYENMRNRLQEYITIAQNINNNVILEEIFDEKNNKINARIYFEVSAEKIIFELRTRHLNF